MQRRIEPILLSLVVFLPVSRSAAAPVLPTDEDPVCATGFTDATDFPTVRAYQRDRPYDDTDIIEFVR
jgi:hypothetical protein